MNAKEEIMKMLKQHQKSCEMYCDWNEYHKTESIITATENAIFDVPSEEEIEKVLKYTTSWRYAEGFKDGCNFILNYKKPKTDGK